MAKKTTKDWLAEWRKEQKESLKKAGFDVDKLTEDQIYIITEPSEAPENFHCDGEISPNQAYTRWIQRLGQAGLTTVQVKMAVKLNF